MRTPRSLGGPIRYFLPKSIKSGATVVRLRPPCPTIYDLCMTYKAGRDYATN
jgi:hypothetical protein